MKVFLINTMSDNNIDKGMITYISLENFVTYNKVCVSPGRNLNLIIGPNGTGKSTIVCAIVLGLGGKPSTIGRALKIADYIKTGCQEAKIEIHLTNGKKNNVVICRRFNLEGKSYWFLDNMPVNFKEIQNLTQAFNIQIDNLCQFLPQDKVQDFSKMNAQELLENTERSVSDPIVLQNHKLLINMRASNKELEKQIENKRTVLESKAQIYEGLKESVTSIKEWKLIKKKIVSLKQKKAWILYDQKRRELLKLKEEKEDAAAEMVALEEEMKPIKNAIDSLHSEIKLLQTFKEEHSNKLKIQNVRLRKMIDDILDYENNIRECESTCKQKIQMEEARDSDIEVAQQQKNKLDNDLSLILKDIGPEEVLMKQRAEMLCYIESKRNTINMLINKSSTLKEEVEHLNLEIRSHEAEQQLLNIENKRLLLLKEKSIDTYKAVQWLKENHNKFSSIIHEPILLKVNVTDSFYAKYLENIIAYRDLIAFVCEDKRDMNMLLHYLRDEQKLQVNVVHSDPTKHVSMEPNISLEHIKQFGFTHYLVSLIEAPSTIMKYLISMYNLNNIPVGTNRIDDNTDQIPIAIRCYFSRNNVYAVSRSKYTGQKSVSMQPVSSTGMLSIVLDKSKQQHLDQKVKTLNEQKKNILNNLQQIEEQVCEQNKELDKYRANRNKCQQDIQQVQALKSRISMIAKKIVDLKNERIGIDEIRKLSTTEIKVIIDKQLNIYEKYKTDMEKCLNYSIKNGEAEIKLKIHQQWLSKKINDSQDLREKLNVAEAKMKQLTSEAQLLKSEVQRMYNEALETTNGINPSDKAFTPINKVFNKLPPTLKEINNEINVAQARVFCIGSNIDAENILHEYETVERDISSLKDFIHKKMYELKQSTQQMASLKEKWLMPLSATIEKINENFTSYFLAMGCVGEVTLAQPNNDMDFDLYGLKIRVKFRDTDQLQELTRHHQSGGERAVTTAIYMISLQELSRVPFRCVDEINQGMDAANERKVFNLLVKMTSRSNSPQYFLLTPKLLPNLEYVETVTVHCVFNGPFMLDHTEFDTEKYCTWLANKMGKEV